MIDFHNCDCMDFMRGLPDKAYDLAIVDPPYGIGDRLTSGGGGGGWAKMVNSGAEEWDIAPDASYFTELFRVSKNQIIWGGNFFDLPPTKQPLCWNKVRPNQKNVSEWEFAWTSFTGRARMFTYCANGGFLLKIPRIHPTQKPIELYEWLLDGWAKPGDKILDTHGGSMSSAIACHYAGYDLTICELDEDYFNAGRARFDNETRQLAFI